MIEAGGARRPEPAVGQARMLQAQPCRLNRITHRADAPESVAKAAK
jgi:hypothetical protein